MAFEVKGQGVPSLTYQWFFWPELEHQKDWIPLDVHEAELHIGNVQLFFNLILILNARCRFKNHYSYFW